MWKRTISSEHPPAREQIQLVPGEGAAGVAVACSSLSRSDMQVSSHPHLPPFPSLLTSFQPCYGSAMLGWENLKLGAEPDMAKQCSWPLPQGVFGHGALLVVNPSLTSLPGQHPIPAQQHCICWAASWSRALTGALWLQDLPP